MATSFNHLSLPFIIDGKYKPQQGRGDSKDLKTIALEAQKKDHSDYLRSSVNKLVQEWQDERTSREKKGLPELPNAASVLLKVDSKAFHPEKLESFGFNVISEQEDGLIIGASSDLALSRLLKRIEQFEKNEGQYKKTAAQIWEIEEREDKWKPEEILSEDLLEQWQTIRDDQWLIVEVSLSYGLNKTPVFNPQSAEESDEAYEERLGKWKLKESTWLIQRDDFIFKRQDEFEAFLKGYKGEFYSALADEGDSFSCKVNITGQCLKDLVLNYPYVFEVSLPDVTEIINPVSSSSLVNNNLTITKPTEDAPYVCIIDSGIQENHAYLAEAIIRSESKSYIPTSSTTADEVANGGHGTRVMGALSFYPDVPMNGAYELPFWVFNARVLDDLNRLNSKMYPAEIMKKIVEDFNPKGARIFNHSLCGTTPFRLRHMSSWAFQLDKLMWEKDVLFVVSSGNIMRTPVGPFKGLESFYAEGKEYPAYLIDSHARLANPAQSCFALTVGSICVDSYNDELLSSIGQKGHPSSFSRSGKGIWGMIKPDVVELGGDYVINSSKDTIAAHESTSLRVIRSTFSGGDAIEKDAIGTTYSAAKVSHIVGMIQKNFPNESTLLYRGLVAQSARWSESLPDGLDAAGILQVYGYGIPDLDRAISNNDFRVTLFEEKKIRARQTHVYKIIIPEEIRTVGEEYDILIEVTLAYKARPRRTRMYTKSYLSTWLDWKASKLGESYDTFCTRVMDESEVQSETDSNSAVSIPWVIKNNSSQGIRSFKLSDSTLQKDWAKVESNQLGEEFCLAVTAHQGWDMDPDSEVPYAIIVSFEAVNKDVQIYEPIRVENQIMLRQEVEVLTS